MRTTQSRTNVRIHSYYPAVITLLIGLSLICHNSRAGESVSLVMDIDHPPGKMVDVGGYQLHIHCLGNGAPTIILESGIGGFSLEWMDIQASLSKQATVCSYDRAGYGWSQRSPLPRTARTMARELDTLLINAGIPGPYLLAGHSFGGYIIRYYAQRHPEKVIGLVMIDASHPEQFKYFPKLAKVESRKHEHPRSYTTRVTRPAYPSNYPEAVRHLAYMLMIRNRTVDVQLQEVMLFEESARQLVKLGNHLPDIPVTVLSRGNRVWPANRYGDAMEIAWWASI